MNPTASNYGLTIWGWVLLLVILWVVSKTLIGNQVLRYGVLLLILVLVLMNTNQFVSQS